MPTHLYDQIDQLQASCATCQQRSRDLVGVVAVWGLWCLAVGALIGWAAHILWSRA